MSLNKLLAFIVDDSMDDRRFMRRILERSDQFTVVAEACDGQEAIEYLQAEGILDKSKTASWPNIVLLDLKMPRKDGFEVIKWIRANLPDHVFIFVTSGSWLESDIQRAQSSGADGYFKKTSNKNEQREMIEKILARVGNGVGH